MTVDASSVARVVTRAEDAGSGISTWTAGRILEESQALASRRRAGDDSLDLLARSLATAREAVLRGTGVRASAAAVGAAAAMAGGAVAGLDDETEALSSIAMSGYWYGLVGDGVHVVVAHEEQVRRFEKHLVAVARFLKQDVGVLLASTDSVQRRRQYAATLTVGAYAEFASDYLRDNLRHSREETVQRGLAVAIVGDVCGVLVDQALHNTYLSGPRVDPPSDRAERIAARLRRGVDYTTRPAERTGQFTDSGVAEVRRAVGWTPGSLESATLAHEVEERLLFREGLVGAHDRAVFADVTTQGFLRNYDTLVGASGDRRECASVLASLYGLDWFASGRGRRRIRLRGGGKVKEPDRSAVSLERIVDGQRDEVYRERLRIRDHLDVPLAVRSLASGVLRHWSADGTDEANLGLADLLGPGGADRPATAQPGAGSADETMADPGQLLEHAMLARVDEIGGDRAGEFVRRVQLTVLDQEWARHLARVRLVQRHGNLLDDDSGTDGPGRQEREMARLYAACRRRMYEYTIGYILHAEP